jgi:twitching motility two-component system response regulator PilG
MRSTRGLHVTLPVEAETGRPEEKGRRNPPIEQLRVIVLDSSPTSRKILEVILRRAGHQVASFDEPLEALRFLAWQGPADLLFLGLDLPRMDGFDVLKHLRGEPRFRAMATIALLDARDGILAQVKARLAGARQVVTKPLVQQRIVTLLAEYACRRTSDREANQRAGHPARNDEGMASRPGRSAPDGTARSPTV